MPNPDKYLAFQMSRSEMNLKDSESPIIKLLFNSLSATHGHQHRTAAAFRTHQHRSDDSHQPIHETTPSRTDPSIKTLPTHSKQDLQTRSWNLESKLLTPTNSRYINRSKTFDH